MNVRDLVELVRAPAALTVPGDSLAGAAAAGWPFGRRTAGLAASSVCLYWAGMALNDYADREVDAVERPGRPIPSGRIRPRVALGVATGLTAAGLGLAGLFGGWRALAVAAPLAGTVWAYDLVLKSTPAGPVAMAAARTLDVLLGAGPGALRLAAPAALAVGAHTLAVTVLSRAEVAGADRRLPAALLGVTAAVTLTAGRGKQRDVAFPGGSERDVALPLGRQRDVAFRATAAALLAGYAGTVGSAQLAAVRDPAPRQVRRAVGAGILGMMPLQAALAARAGSRRSAVLLAAAFPVARRLARRVSPT
jgi:4-hydroxybenzoate polyprenyltransferase